MRDGYSPVRFLHGCWPSLLLTGHDVLVPQVLRCVSFISDLGIKAARVDGNDPVRIPGIVFEKCNREFLFKCGLPKISHITSFIPRMHH